MRGFVLTLCSTALLLTVTSAQTTPSATAKKPATAKSNTPSAPPATAGSNAAVTIDHVCAPGTPGGKAFGPSCKTVITDAEMDRLVEALNPDMTPSVRQQLGRSMAEWTAYAAKARELGLDKTPEFAEVIKFAKTQMLAQALARNIQKQVENISPAEIQSFYDSHKNELEEFNFLRVIIPRESPTKDKPVDEAAETKYAQEIRDRLAKGEDAKALQTEAFKHSGQTAQEPPVEIDGRRRGSLPPSQASIFELKPGEVSTVQPDSGAFFVYKLVSHTTTSLEKATPDIKKAIAKERIDKAIADLNSQFSVKLSDTYFGPQTEDPPRGAPSMRAPGSKAPTAAPPSQAAPSTSQVPK